MKLEQKSVKVYEIEVEDYKSTISFIDRNYPFLKNSLVKLKNDNDGRVSEYIARNNLCEIICKNMIKYKDSKEIEKKTDTAIKNESKNIENIEEKIEPSITNGRHLNSLVINRIVRGGEEFDENSDIIITNRVNQGATIKSNGNISIFAKCDGNIICNGDILIIGKVDSGNIIFNEIKIDNDKLNSTLMKIIYNDEHRIKIETLIQ